MSGFTPVTPRCFVRRQEGGPNTLIFVSERMRAWPPPFILLYLPCMRSKIGHSVFRLLRLSTSYPGGIKRMAKMLKCGDLMPGCTVVIEGKDENEVMAKASEHARQKHGVYSVSPDMAAKAKAAIIDVCVNNRHQRGARVLFEYETTGKPRGVGAPTAPRGRPWARAPAAAGRAGRPRPPGPRAV